VDLVREQVLFGATDDHRVSCSGPALMLDPQAAVQLALVLHELATNARKYGALSVPTGRLEVQWELRIDGEGNNLVLEWKERGGPKVSTPKERGFGSMLIERTLSAHRGEVSMRYAAAGVTCGITLPLPQQARPSFEQAAAASTTETTPSLPSGRKPHGILHGRRVIIIEDEPLVAMDIESTLTAAGCKVVGSAGTLDKAKLIVAQVQCDAAIVDIALAGHPVDELAAALTQKNIPLVLLIESGRDGLTGQCQAAVELKKPFSQDQLTAAVEQLFYQTAAVVQLRPKSR
jgi:CheY-like chemotaxis protein